jgi:hypothetical protein
MYMEESLSGERINRGEIAVPEDKDIEVEKLRQAIVGLESQERELGLNFTAQIAQLQQRLEETRGVSQSGSGVVATAGGVAAGEDGVAVGRDVGGHVIVAGNGATIVIGEQPIAMTAVQRGSALGRYLSYVISHNRYLQLQGIRSGGRLVNIELEQIYVTLKATRVRTVDTEEAWLAEERGFGRAEWQKPRRAQASGRAGRPRLGQEHAAAFDPARFCRPWLAAGRQTWRDRGHTVEVRCERTTGNASGLCRTFAMRIAGSRRAVDAGWPG